MHGLRFWRGFASIGLGSITARWSSTGIVRPLSSGLSAIANRSKGVHHRSSRSPFNNGRRTFLSAVRAVFDLGEKARPRFLCRRCAWHPSSGRASPVVSEFRGAIIPGGRFNCCNRKLTRLIESMSLRLWLSGRSSQPAKFSPAGSRVEPTWLR
jgi:hypothetical protein